MITRRPLLVSLAALALATTAQADTDTVKIGVILPMTGPSASTGKQIDAAIKLFLAQNGSRPAARRLKSSSRTITASPTSPPAPRRS